MSEEFKPYEEVIVKFLKDFHERLEYDVVHNNILPLIHRVRNEVLLEKASKSEKYTYERWQDLENTITLHKSAMQTLDQLEAIKKAMENDEQSKQMKEYISGLDVIVKSLRRRLSETI